MEKNFLNLVLFSVVREVKLLKKSAVKNILGTKKRADLLEMDQLEVNKNKITVFIYNVIILYLYHPIIIDSPFNLILAKQEALCSVSLTSMS